MSTTYSISELAGEFAVTPRTLRFYEEKGLLSPRRRGQTRLYSAADRTRLKLVLRGKRLGLSLEESAEIIGMYDPLSDNRAQLEKLLAAICKRREELRTQLRDLQTLLRDLDESEARTRRALHQAGGSRRRRNGEQHA